ncbi:MAG: DNA-processing protein DprA [Syntrophales bacterium]|jgi:DNA processing protein
MEQEQRRYWLALRTINGLGIHGLRTLIAAFGTPQRVFSASLDTLCSIPGIGKIIARRIVAFNDWAALEEELAYYDREKISLLSWQDAFYPSLLPHIYDPPALLFTKGVLQEDEKCIAVVGSRLATVYGTFITEKLCRELAVQGITVVSGMARGIDSAAHRGALAGLGRTIAVLGNGPDIIYPPENSTLCRRILERGALLTEYPAKTPPHQSHFPARNRIISGMSLGVLVVEAGERSGSLITAKFALEQNREVFAIPGAIDAPGSKGPHKLLKEGAILVETIDDILDVIAPHLDRISDYPSVSQEMPEKTGKILQTEAPRPELTGDEKALWSQLRGSPKEVDELIGSTGLACQTVQRLLTMLEVKGYIQKMPGSKYKLRE